MAFKGTRSGLHQLRLDNSEMEMENDRLGTKNVPGSPKSENAIHVRKTAGIGPRSVSVMDKVNNWFRRNSAANSPVPGTSNRHDIDGGQGDIRPDTGDIAAEQPKSPVGGIRLSDSESEGSVELRPRQKRGFRTKPRSVNSNDLSSDDEAVSVNKSMKNLAKAFNKGMHKALNSVSGLVKQVGEDVREMATALQVTQVSSLVLLEKMQEKMEVLAQRQGNSQINPLQPSEAGIKQKCSNRAKAVVCEPKNASPMGQGSQGSLGMHDESLPVREMVTGTEPVNTGMVNLAVQGNSGCRESETRGSNQMDMGSMGHDSHRSCEGHDEYRALRGMATGTQPVNTGMVNLEAPNNSGFSGSEKINCSWGQVGTMSHNSQMAYTYPAECIVQKEMATGTQTVNTGRANLATLVSSGHIEPEIRDGNMRNGHLPQTCANLPERNQHNFSQYVNLRHSESTSAVKGDETKKKSVTKRTKSGRRRDGSSDSESSDSSEHKVTKTKKKSASKKPKSVRKRDISSDSGSRDEDTDGSDKVSEDEVRARVARGQAHGKNVKIQPFKGKGVESWPVWYNRFSEAAERRGWCIERQLDELLMRMQGEAAEFVYGQLKSHIRNDYKMLVAELNSRFNLVETEKSFRIKFAHRDQKVNELPEDYAAELRRLYDKSYPRRDNITRQEDLLRRFLEGLVDEKIKFQVEYIKEPDTLEEAVSEVVKFMEVKRRGQVELSDKERRAKKTRAVKYLEISDDDSDDSDDNRAARVPPRRNKMDGKMDSVEKTQAAPEQTNQTTGQHDIMAQMKMALGDAVKEITDKCVVSNNKQTGGRHGPGNQTQKQPKPFGQRNGVQNNNNYALGNGGRQNNGRGPQQMRGDLKCYHCSQSGHFKRNCPILLGTAQIQAWTQAMPSNNGMLMYPSPQTYMGSTWAGVNCNESHTMGPNVTSQTMTSVPPAQAGWTEPAMRQGTLGGFVADVPQQGQSN